MRRRRINDKSELVIEMSRRSEWYLYGLRVAALSCGVLNLFRRQKWRRSQMSDKSSKNNLKRRVLLRANHRDKIQLVRKFAAPRVALW